MRLILIRHGRTPANAEKKLIGQKYDEDITDFGIQQICRLSEELKNIQFSALITSPLTRAVHSSKILSANIELSNALIVDEAVIERDYGEFECLVQNEVASKKSTYGISNNGRDTTNYFPNGLGNTETRNSVFCRMQQSIEKSIQTYGANSIVAYMTHGGVIYSYITEALKIPETIPRPFKIREASFIACNIDSPNIVEVMSLWNNPVQENGGY